MSDNILQKIIRPTPHGRVWQFFILIMILAITGGLIDGGEYYNRGVDKLAAKTNGTVVLPKMKEIPFRLGLDLLGGTQLTYQADMASIPAKDQANAIEGVREVIERRVNFFGVSEPVVQTNISGGNYRVIVELAGVKDINEAVKTIGETPLLEFKEQTNEQRKLTDEEKKQISDYNKDAEKKAAEVLGKLISGGDFAALAKEYSEEQTVKENGGDLGWVTENDNPEAIKNVKNLKSGQITDDLVNSAASYEIYKLEGKRVKANPFNEKDTEKEVKASHILICFTGIANCESGLTKEQALDKINKIKKDANPKNFSALAKEFSTEPGADSSGGSLGWFDRLAMVKPFADAVFAQKVGSISEPVESEFGYHLIYKEAERTIEEYNIRRIAIRKMTEADIIGEQKDWKNTELTGKNLTRASVQFNPNDNYPEVSLEFDDEGAKMFADITSRNIDKPVAIFLDKYPISTPTVNEKISGGKAVISGKFNIQDAKLLAQRLNAGALPVPINLLSQQIIGPSLGQKSVSDSLYAVMFGFIFVALFMITIYRFPGFISVCALLIYTILVLAVFKIWPVTLTLAGLAGFIMSIGMAVDANVLIFSRLREELADGKPLGLALEDGFRRAWPSIRDSNVSTLITCFILIQFSTSIVKGFAITLALGVIVSMFSAIFITRNFLKLIPESWLVKRHWLIGGIKSEIKQ